MHYYAPFTCWSTPGVPRSPSVPTLTLSAPWFDIVVESWRRLRGAKKPRAGADVFTTGSGRCRVCVVQGVSICGVGGNVSMRFFLPEPLRRPPQLGFSGLVL